MTSSQVILLSFEKPIIRRVSSFDDIINTDHFVFYANERCLISSGVVYQYNVGSFDT